MDATVVMVRTSGSRPTREVEKLREVVIRAVAELGIPLLLSMDDDLPHYVERIDRARTVLIVSDSPSAHAAAVRALSEQRGVVFSLLVAPTSFADWGGLDKEWAEGLRAVMGDNLVLLTDSLLSRAVVEGHLRAARADVRVLQSEPRADEDRATLFDAMTSWQEGDPPLRSSGSNWDFSAPAPPSTAVRPAAEQGIPPVEVVRSLVSERSLEGQPLHIGVLGHKLSFIDELARDLARASGSTVELDEWANLGAPSDVPRARRVLNRSEVVIGEWGRPNNVWIQEHAPADRRLIVRVHRYEVTTEFPRSIDMERFDAGVVIVPWVGRALVQKFDWPVEKLVYIPNYVNTRHFRRPKLPGAELTLGLVGITPDLKRLDLALDLLARLRSVDLRYALRVRGQLPTAHIHWRTKDAISEQWASVLFRLRTDPLLRNAVHFDEPGRDMAAWLEGVGVILSTSDLEGSHVALAEGVASGALPIVRPWPGARTLWPEEMVMPDIESAVEQVLRSRDLRWREETVSRLAAHPSLDQDRVLGAWWDLVQGDRRSAQEAFGPIDWTADWYEPVDL